MIFDPILDLFRGKAVTIPPLDGRFKLSDADERWTGPNAYWGERS